MAPCESVASVAFLVSRGFEVTPAEGGCEGRLGDTVVPVPECVCSPPCAPLSPPAVRPPLVLPWDLDGEDDKTMGVAA